MKKSTFTNGIMRWSLTFALLAWGVNSFMVGDWGILQAMAVGGAIGLVIFFGAYLLGLKRQLLTMYSSFSHRSAHINEFPRLDVPELERLTAEWEALGFVHHSDREGRSSNPQLNTCFSRLLEYQSQEVIVELMQEFTPKQAFPFNSSLHSFWGQREQVQQRIEDRDRTSTTIAPIASPTPLSSQAEEARLDDLKFWVLSTHNRASNPYFRVLNHPRVLQGRLEASATPAQLWQLHQQRAALAEARLGTPALRGDLPSLLRAHGRRLNDISVRRLQATSAWKLARYSLTRKPAPPFYDGELAPLNP